MLEGEYHLWGQFKLTRAPAEEKQLYSMQPSYFSVDLVLCPKHSPITHLPNGVIWMGFHTSV